MDLTDNYSGESNIFILNPFTTEPAICQDRVSYECQGVTGPSSVNFNNLCDGFDVNDGTLDSIIDYD